MPNDAQKYLTQRASKQPVTSLLAPPVTLTQSLVLPLLSDQLYILKFFPIPTLWFKVKALLVTLTKKK